jgi:hypothetical protein
MVFNIHTALKQLDVTLKQVKKTRAQLPKLNREKVDQELKILLLTTITTRFNLHERPWRKRNTERLENI